MSWIDDIKEGFNDLMKNAVTLGKHSEVKKHAQQYADSLQQLEFYKVQYEKTCEKLKTGTISLDRAKTDAIEVCNAFCQDFSGQFSWANLVIPELKKPEMKIPDTFKKGVSSEQLNEAYNKNKVGQSLRFYTNYQRTHQAVKGSHKNQYILAAVAAYELFNTITASVKEAKKNLSELIGEESKVNRCIADFTKVTLNLEILIKSIDQHTAELNNCVTKLHPVKDHLIHTYRRIYKDPAWYKKVIRFFRKLFGMDIYTNTEKRRLAQAHSSFNTCMQTIGSLISKNYEYGEYAL